jgi:hypothetical protein
MVWTPTSVTSRWVRGEAREADERRVLVPVRFDQARLRWSIAIRFRGQAWVRILGEVTQAAADTLRLADHIFIEEPRK